MPSGQGLSRGQPTVGWERGLRTEEQLVLGVISREQGAFQKRWDQQQLCGCGTSSTHSRPGSVEVTELTPQLHVSVCKHVRMYCICFASWKQAFGFSPPPKLILPNN